MRSPSLLRSTLLIIGVLMALVPPETSHAQANSPSNSKGGLTVVEWEFNASNSWVSSPTATIPMGRFQGLVPLTELLPQTTPDSHIQFLSVAAGMTSGDNDREQVWELSLLDLLLQRAWWSGSVRIVNIESRTFFSHDRTWFEIGTGPGFHVQGQDAAFSFRAEVQGGRRSTGILTDNSGRHEGTGWHGSIRLQTAAKVRGRVVMTLSASRTAFSKGNLGMDEVGAGVDVTFREAWTLNSKFRYLPETGSSGATDVARTQMSLGLTYRMTR